MSPGGVREWSQDEIRRVGYRTVDLIAQHLWAVPHRKVFHPVPARVRDRLQDSLAIEGCQSADSILDEFAELVEPYPFGNGHPSFFGWLNSPPTVIGVFAEALAAAMNPSCAGGNHAAVHVERAVIAWFCREFGFPPDAMGLLVSGGSMATLTALAVARHAAAQRAGLDVRAAGLRRSPNLAIYKTREGHACAQKAIELLGIGSESIRVVPHDPQLRMKPAMLEEMIRADLAAGVVPMAVVTSAGTVNTGAIDPLDAIADVCARHNVWLHVDGAYGAPAILTSQYRADLMPIRRCDSLAIDPHKWLFVPVEAGLVIVRHSELMRETFSLVPPYLRTDGSLDGVAGPPWFSEYGFQQTRGFRALKVWMALKHCGRTGYRQALEQNLALADQLAERLRGVPDVQLFPHRSLSIVCFRYAPESMRDDAPALNALNERLLARIQLGGDAFLTGTNLDDALWLRACIVNYRTTPAHIDGLCALVGTLGAETVSDGS